MTILTKNEYDEAKTKVKQIEDFIRKDILPYMEGCHEIPFGEEKERSGRSHLNLYIYHSNNYMSLSGYSGHLFISFDEDYEPRECGCGVSIYNSLNYGGNFCYQLIKDWKGIKNKLLDLKVKKKREESERKAVLQKFEI